jgi:TonB family protein
MESFENIQLSFKCPKALDELKPCQSNWYCDGCKKMVYDFRGMGEKQILQAFEQSGQKLCGVYDADRIRIVPQKTVWYKWATAAIMALGVTFLNGCNSNSTMGEIGKVRMLPPKDTIHELQTVGMIMPLYSRPEFPGGENGLAKYFGRHIKNNEHNQKRAFIQFTIEKDGSITNIKVVRSAGRDMDKQLIKTIKGMPKWKPAIQDGKPISIQYTIPIHLDLIT